MGGDLARLLFAPLDRPGVAGAVASPFSASWTDTTWLLRREAGMLNASEVVVCVDASPRNMRQDGGIRADAKVGSDSVEVFLPQSKVGPLRYSCHLHFGGRWAQRSLAGWQANVRAVALGMEALRKVERYGLGSGTEQYRGFTALPPGDPIALGAAMTVEAAAVLLASHDPASATSADYRVLQADRMRRFPDMVEGAYRRAVRVHHPDAGGDPALFRSLTEARDLLRHHHAG